MMGPLRIRVLIRQHLLHLSNINNNNNNNNNKIFPLSTIPSSVSDLDSTHDPFSVQGQQH